MEKFKAAEKEMKTKAFSKEGLIAAAKLGPEEKAKLEMSNWLTSMVDELSRQIEAAEAEIEQMMATSKKSKKSTTKEDRAGTLEHQNERRQWHISRLEILLRMLENGSLEVDQINDIKEDISYFVESNAEEDFEEDEGIYDEFNLDEEEEAFGLRDAEEEKIESPPTPPPAPAPEEPVAKAVAKETKKDEVPPPKAKDEKEKKAKKTATTASVTTTTAEPPLKERVVTNFEQGKLQPTSLPVPPPAHKTPAPAATLPPIRYAAAAAAAVATTPAAGAPSPSTAVPVPASETAADTSTTDVPVEAEGDVSAASADASGAAPARSDARLPDTLSDLVTSFEWAKQKALLRDSNLSHVQRSLDASYAGGAPEPVDSESPKHYVPKDPFPTPSYYPQSPASLFDNPALYAKFDVDTLFYIFYYQQGTYHQYLAARELKKQSWRFHKQYLTWFQRHSEPQAITDEYEQGAYVYFDWEGSWCQRRKNDFRFEYRWLEDN